ncbi:hypothetical protein R75461_08003 [Paraburkholderia nemoris]|uniref:phage baseplate protein n=1 Tax=Paraburkholderia nemoris TaxID=2793076 RepID=UPI00190CA299|nr:MULTISPECIES: hypothetical protein [Paraburkholderia]MBK3786769.1 hypothetical protein [Paraburkholderia aspalathi]CAE6861445.1 hypothetical protein R75461_08003 [Paraburkholderia nemoris]
MSLIPFPDVPPVAGVPDLNRLPLAVGVLTGLTQAIQALDYFGLLSVDVPQWIIADDQDNALVTPDSVVDLGNRGEQRIASYPVEAGSFAAYNKVATPQELTLRLSCGGRNMSRELFLLELEFLWESLTLVNVVTPDATYRSFNIDRLDYQRKSSSGLSLIVAEIHLSEIRVSAQAAYSNTATAPGNDPQSQGPVNTNSDTSQLPATVSPSTQALLDSPTMTPDTKALILQQESNMASAGKILDSGANHVGIQ